MDLHQFSKSQGWGAGRRVAWVFSSFLKSKHKSTNIYTNLGEKKEIPKPHLKEPVSRFFKYSNIIKAKQQQNTHKKRLFVFYTVNEGWKSAAPSVSSGGGYRHSLTLKQKLIRFHVWELNSWTAICRRHPQKPLILQSSTDIFFTLFDFIEIPV